VYNSAALNTRPEKIKTKKPVLNMKARTPTARAPIVSCVPTGIFEKPDPMMRRSRE